MDDVWLVSALWVGLAQRWFLPEYKPVEALEPIPIAAQESPAPAGVRDQ